ncbi:MAG: molybdopterin-dependent oxidoreductase [Microthrixaceae bacterium]
MSSPTETQTAQLQEPRDSEPWWIGAIAGLASAAAGLAIGELLAGVWTSVEAPIVSVGNRVVDNVPRALKTWAIDTFGTNDKAVLLGMVALLLGLGAALLGMQAVRRGIRFGLIGIGIFSAIGMLASLGRGTSGLLAPLPTLIGGLTAAATLAFLMHRGNLDFAGERATQKTASKVPVDQTATRAIDQPQQAQSMLVKTPNRRRFLGTAAGVTAGAVVIGGMARWLRTQGTAAAERLKIVLPRPTTALADPPLAVELGVAGVSPFFTPTSEFYRIDTALTVPRVDLSTWTLEVMGQVSKPLSFSYEQLLERPMIEADITIACVSNEVGGDLIGTARWLGCRLDDLLAEAGVSAKADQIVGRSVDGFTAGFPTALLDGRDALVAVGMNGEPLPTKHGFPARLIVPGVYGYVSATKWLSQIELTTFEEFQGYWIPRGWSVEGPVKTQSRIDTPRNGASVQAGEEVPIAGVAWAQIRGITKVEVQVDDGPWQEATLGQEYQATTWRQWKIDWKPSSGKHKIAVRATDGDGKTQTDQLAPVAPDGATGWHTITVYAQ